MGSGWWYMLMDRYLGGMSVGGGPLRVEFAVWGMCVVPSCAGCVVRVVMRYVCVQRAGNAVQSVRLSAAGNARKPQNARSTSGTSSSTGRTQTGKRAV